MSYILQKDKGLLSLQTMRRSMLQPHPLALYAYHVPVNPASCA